MPAEDLVIGVKQSAVYLKELWYRLNGGGHYFRKKYALPIDLPRPESSEQQIRTAMSQYSIEIEKLEKKLKDASRARESKLQKVGLKDRLQLTFQLKIMDDEVSQLTRLLAVILN